MYKISEDLLKEFNTYTGNFQMEKDDIEMKTRILDYATEIVESYLGY